MKYHLFFIVILTFLIACGNEKVDPGYGVEFYLLESYDTLSNIWRYQIDESTVIPKEDPIVYYYDIFLYDSTEHIFHISDKAKNLISNLYPPVTGTAFALMVNSKLVYTGYFWPGYSSSNCDWMIIDPTQVEFANEMQVTAGYPGENDKLGIPDKRNDPLIIEMLSRDKKLL